VHLERGEARLLARDGTHAVHCPGANLKLASGVARIPELLAAGVNVALGADGAACNNRLDAFHEMRLAATLHLPRAGAAALPAADVLAMATIHGARALGLGDEIGSLEPENARTSPSSISPPLTASPWATTPTAPSRIAPARAT
jgi:cytosine/adenosine deaminase-related metal-dependent hydrolase